MLPNLQEATQEYWQKLNEIEKAYQQGKISKQEVDLEVASLMTELGRKRRAAINYFRQSFQLWLTHQKEILIGLTMLIAISYLWILSNLN
jgi:hypothetical protein